jgi:hypothetical protein
MHFFGGDQRKAFVQIKAHLVSKHTSSASARTVGFGNAVCVDMAHEIFVLASDGAHNNSVFQ